MADFALTYLNDSVADLEERVRELPFWMQNYVIGQGLRGAANLVRKELRETTRFRDRTGRLRKSIRVTTDKGSLLEAADIPVVRVGGAKRNVRYLHLVEEGHKGGYYKVYGRLGILGRRVFINSRARPHPFIEPTIRETQSEQLQEIERGASRAMKANENKLRRIRAQRGV